MKKRMLIMLITVTVLFGLIFLYKAFMGYMMGKYFASMKNPTQTVSSQTVRQSSWIKEYKSTGSLRAVQGVDVTTSLAGQVQTIYFKPGDFVTENTLLVQLNAASEIGQLQALEANADLARITYERDLAQFKAHGVSKQTVDADLDNWKSLQGQVAQQYATVQKKSIRAPFSGKLGISAVNLGQWINTGDKIVNLQTLDPIYVDFYLPQQALADIKVGQSITLTSDLYPGKTFAGKITTIEPSVTTSNRNVEVEATLPNPKGELVPGAFGYVVVDVGQARSFLTLPQTAITFNPYGDVVYILKEETSSESKDDKTTYIAKQSFVTTGETRGDQVQVLTGVKEGDEVVTSGQLKLKNGSRVVVNNEVVPANNPNPVLTDE